MPRELFHQGSRGDTARFNRKKKYMYPKDTLNEWNVNKTAFTYSKSTMETPEYCEKSVQS